jgi:hypothetical protein
MVDEFPAFLIGPGPAPLVWLAAQTGSDTWSYVVKASKSLHPSVRVDVDLVALSVAVFVGSDLVLQVRHEVPHETSAFAEVSKVDLRPLGLNLYGDSKGLFVGTNHFVGNTFKGTATAFSVSVKPRAAAASA